MKALNGKAAVFLLAIASCVQAQDLYPVLGLTDQWLDFNPVALRQVESAYQNADAGPISNMGLVMSVGSSNSASITQVNTGTLQNTAGLLQLGSSNQAAINQTGSGNISGIVQVGTKNNATTTIKGNNNVSGILQYGSYNSAAQNITLSSPAYFEFETGNAAVQLPPLGSQSYFIVQMGSGNTISETQGAPLSKPYGVTQIGNNLHLIIQDWTFPALSK